MVNYEEQLNVLEANAREWVEKCNQFTREGNMKEFLDANAHATNIVKEYAKIKREEVFINCRQSEDPMITACKTLKYSILRIKTEKPKEVNYPVYSLEYTDRLIDLLALDKFCNPTGIGHDVSWKFKVERFGKLMAEKVGADIGDDVKRIDDSYYMKYKASREVDLGKNPLSNTQMQKTVQYLVSLMIGEEYKANLHDVKFIKHAFTKEGKGDGDIDAAPYRKLVNLMEKVCYRILTNSKYTLNFKIAKQ